MRLRRRASSDTEDEAEVEAVASASDTGEALQGRQNSLFIDPGLAPRVQQLISDQHAVLAQMGDALEQLFEVAAGLEEHEEQQVSLNFKLLMQRVLQLDTRVRELIDLRNTVALRIEVLCELKHAVAQGTAGANIREIYEARVQERLAAYIIRTTRQKYARDPAYIEFRSRVWEVHSEGAMPPLQDVIPMESGDEGTNDGDEDDDIVVGGRVQNFRCPISASLLVDPVINVRCQHVYSRANIEEYLRRDSRPTLCPESGCEASVSASTLRNVPGLQRRVDRFARQLARREERRGTQSDAVLLE